jgi:hypothetical protein
MYILQRELDSIGTAEDLKAIRSQYAKMLRDEMEMP